jgi:hypothetical protein
MIHSKTTKTSSGGADELLFCKTTKFFMQKGNREVLTSDFIEENFVSVS